MCSGSRSEGSSTERGLGPETQDHGLFKTSTQTSHLDDACMAQTVVSWLTQNDFIRFRDNSLISNCSPLTFKTLLNWIVSPVEYIIYRFNVPTSTDKVKIGPFKPIIKILKSNIWTFYSPVKATQEWSLLQALMAYHCCFWDLEGFKGFPSQPLKGK